jgi:hypothetical protein
MPSLGSRDRLRRFVLRARKVLAHSLVRDHLELLNTSAHGTFTVHVKVNIELGEGEHRLQMKLPPEERGSVGWCQASAGES